MATGARHCCAPPRGCFGTRALPPPARAISPRRRACPRAHPSITESQQALLAAVVQEGMDRALVRQPAALTLAEAVAVTKRCPRSPRERLRVPVRNRLDVSLGPDSDFITVMRHEWRSLLPAEREAAMRLEDAYEASWTAVLRVLHDAGPMDGDLRVAHPLLFGAVHWTAQWYDPARVGQGRYTLDKLADQALRVFLGPRP
jgi:AcrR family transcriptional regulator